ncbi:hypothetical protein RRF57_010450 [Xylaria bambusicola]|uniref:Uncharacterized protein n=1 Tax=Xylaria bambusicola TaxID=326684 RepID=A0AAN7USD0_9PEZI
MHGILSPIDTELFVLIFFFIQIVPTHVFLEATLNLQFAKPPEHIGALAVLPADKRGGGVHLESVDTGDVAFSALGWYKSRVDLEHDIMERGTKIGTVDGGVRETWDCIHPRNEHSRV